MNFISLILSNLTTLIPLKVIAAWEAAVMTTFGKWPMVVGPGVWLFMPGADRFAVFDTRPDVVELAEQALTTQDGRTVNVSLSITFQIVDTLALQLGVQEWRENMCDTARRHLAKRVREKTFAEMIDPTTQTEFERSCKGTTETRVKDWGIKILDVGFAQFAPTRVYSLSNL